MDERGINVRMIIVCDRLSNRVTRFRRLQGGALVIEAYEPAAQAGRLFGDGLSSNNFRTVDLVSKR